MDVDRPSSWKKYKSGMCKGCWGGCCTMPVEVQISDLVRLGLVSDDEVATSSLRKIAKKLEREGFVKNYRASSGLFMLMQKANRDCIFMDKDRQCTRYEKRPDVCRKFPEIGPRPGWCPHLQTEVFRKLRL